MAKKPIVKKPTKKTKSKIIEEALHELEFRISKGYSIDEKKLTILNVLRSFPCIKIYKIIIARKELRISVKATFSVENYKVIRKRFQSEDGIEGPYLLASKNSSNIISKERFRKFVEMLVEREQQE